MLSDKLVCVDREENSFVMNRSQYEAMTSSDVEIAKPEIINKILGLAHFYLGALLASSLPELAKRHINIVCSPLYAKYLPQDVVELAQNAQSSN